MLTVNNLTIALREGTLERNVAENISFTLETGKSLGIVGESGSGKTITALSILQLLPPGMRIGGGQIQLDGKVNLAGLDEKKMRAIRGQVISMIFQEPMTSLNPSMCCGDQVAEAARSNDGLPAADVRARVLSLFEEVHLPARSGFYRKYPHQLSGGQRQRIMIAMALAGNPQILIADEPTTALDVTVQKKILEVLQEIRRNRSMGMLFISHDLEVIRTVCENALVMFKGKIVESGKVSQLFRKPEHPYTRGLIACRPLPGEHPFRLPTLADFMDPGKLPDEPSGDSVDKQDSFRDKLPLLEVNNLRVDYTLKKNLMGKPVTSLHAVDSVSFNIIPGETLGLIGESGCGKSTLGRSIIRLIQAGEGEILYRGVDISSLKGKELISYRQKVQFIFQDPYSSLNPRIAIGPSIMEVMKVHGIHKTSTARRNAVLELLARVGLGLEHFERYPHEFSGGQRQRIGLARALATGPELIICDESVSSLDVSVQAMILNLLNDLKDSFNLTYLFISHDLSVVRYMSDRILVMKNGKLVEQGSGEEIFSDPSNEYTQKLIDSILVDPR